MLFETVFRIRVNYKSGISEEFDVTECELNSQEMSWKTAGVVRPLRLNYDEVESVWQLSAKRRLKFFN